MLLPRGIDGEVEGLSKSQLRIGADDGGWRLYLSIAGQIQSGLRAMTYEDIQAAQVVGHPHEAALGDLLPGETLITKLTSVRLRHVMALLDKAVRQLQPSENVAQGTILEATSLLRSQINQQSWPEPADANGRLLAWQARKVRDYIDAHIAGPILVADLCALIQRSEAHFSRAFKHTFGEPPHAFVIRRRLELAAQCMVQTDAPLRDIAPQCGFTDQAHLCKHFRQVTGQTPAAWRRAHRTHHEDGAPRSDGPPG